MPSLLLCNGVGGGPASTWSQPDSTNSSSFWFGEANAIDGNDATYCTGSSGDFSEYLVLTYTVAKTGCTAIKVLVAKEPRVTTDSTLLVEISTNGADWTTLIDGGVSPIPNATQHGWQNYNFAAQTVKAIRFKRPNVTAEYVYGAQTYGV